jgi:hypothetical protein
MTQKFLRVLNLQFLLIVKLDVTKITVELSNSTYQKDGLFITVCCNPCNWDGRYWMPTMAGNP